MSLLDGLVSYWKLDELSGTRADSHGSNDLSVNGTVGSAAGILGNAADFESGTADAYLSHADNADLSIGGHVSFAWQAWVKPESIPGHSMIVLQKGTVDAANLLEYSLSLSSAGVPSFGVSDGTNRVFVNWSAALTAGVWSHIVVWHDADADVIGITVNDGTPVTLAHSTGVRDGTAALALGSNTAANRYYDGLIDEVAFWKGRTLTAGEITQLYNGGAGLPYDQFGGAASGHPAIRRLGGFPLARPWQPGVKVF